VECPNDANSSGFDKRELQKRYLLFALGVVVGGGMEKWGRLVILMTRGPPLSALKRNMDSEAPPELHFQRLRAFQPQKHYASPAFVRTFAPH
jgi:hypothetical protein